MEEAKKFKKKKKEKSDWIMAGDFKLTSRSLKIHECEFLALHSAPYLWA